VQHEHFLLLYDPSFAGHDCGFVARSALDIRVHKKDPEQRDVVDKGQFVFAELRCNTSPKFLV
jgi:hypothetical protein